MKQINFLKYTTKFQKYEKKNLDRELRKLTNSKKVRDHCHIFGTYRSPAHSGCNLQLQVKASKMHIPVLFHNGTGYDNHIVMQGIGAMECKYEISCIPQNYEKYLSYKLGNIRFLDSMQFMKCSLEKFVENIGTGKCNDENCNHLFRLDEDRCFVNID